MATTDALIISPKNIDRIALLKQCKFDHFALNRSSETHGQFAICKGSILMVETDKALIIFADLAQMYFSDLEPSEVELFFQKQYKEFKLLAFLNQTTSNSYLFNYYIENGERIRIKSGTEDTIFIDDGTELSEETRDYEKVNTEQGIRYVRDGVEYTHDQVGASQGELIAERLLGYPYDQVWSDKEINQLEYVYAKEVDKIFLPQHFYLDRFKSFTDHLFTQPYYNVLLDSQMRQVVLPLFRSNGYVYNDKENTLTKTIANISQEIKLVTDGSKGIHTSQLNFHSVFSHESLAEQLIRFFGTKHWNPRNPKLEIRDQFVLMTNIPDSRTFESNAPLMPFNYDKLGIVLKTYLEKSLLPLSDFFFDDIKFYNSINNPLISIAALILNKQEPLGFAKMKKQLERMDYPRHVAKAEYQVKIFERLLEHTAEAISLNQILELDDVDLKANSFAFDDSTIMIEFETPVNIPEEPELRNIEKGNDTVKPTIEVKENWVVRFFKKLIKGTK